MLANGKFSTTITGSIYMSDLAYLKVIVHGRVQGVYFRAFVSQAAKALSLRGFVRNTRGGDVELEAEGDRANIEELLSQLYIGPPKAIIKKMDITWSDYQGLYTSFDVRY